MTKTYIITGTDTDVGKTVAASMLTLELKANYWKPIQSGVESIDTKIVQKHTQLPEEHFFPESYIFTEPLSPHRAAEIDGLTVFPDQINPPPSTRTLFIEGAGGLMVPITRDHLQINMFQRWGFPVILVARTALGTLNHTLLSLEALWERQIPIHGIVFVGPDNQDNIRTITEFSGEKILGRIPPLDPINPDTLKHAFEKHFNIEDF